MITDDELVGMRANSVRAMPDAGQITRPGNGGAIVGNNWVPAVGSEIYDGVCDLNPRPVSERTVVIGDKLVRLHSYTLRIPVTAPQVRPDDVFVMNESACAQLIGRPLVVRDVVYRSNEITRVLTVEDHPEVATP